MPPIPRPSADECAPFYQKYIDRVPDGDLLTLLADQFQDTMALLRPISAEQAAFRYAPGKWSVTEVVGHMADTERVMAYRALRIARGDVTPLPGFDENAYAAAAGFDRRPLGDVLDELAAIRQATLALLRGLAPETLSRMGTASGHPVSVRALAYIIAGHERHHVALLQERYRIGAAVRPS